MRDAGSGEGERRKNETRDEGCRRRSPSSHLTCLSHYLPSGALREASELTAGQSTNMQEAEEKLSAKAQQMKAIVLSQLAAKKEESAAKKQEMAAKEQELREVPSA